MAVYVDNLCDHGWKLGPSCHMIADTLSELHATAKRIGLKRQWYQPRSFPHYDLTEGRRNLALNAGVTELGRREFIAKLRALRAEGAIYG